MEDETFDARGSSDKIGWGFGVLAQFGKRSLWQQPRSFRVDDLVVHAAPIGAEKVAPHADRPGGRRHVERQRLLDLVQQVERVAGLAVELVDKSDDRHVAQPAHLEELAGLLLDAPLVLLGAASSTITITSASWFTFLASAPYLLSEVMHEPLSTYGLLILLPMAAYMIGPAVLGAFAEA